MKKLWNWFIKELEKKESDRSILYVVFVAIFGVVIAIVATPILTAAIIMLYISRY